METFAVVETANNQGLIHSLEGSGQKTIRLPAVRWPEGLSLQTLIPGHVCIFFLDAASCESVLRESDDVEVLLDMRVGAADTSVVEVLRGHGVHADIVPLQATSKAILSSLEEYYRSDHGAVVFIGGSAPCGERLVLDFAEGDYDPLDSVTVQSAWELDASSGKSRALLMGGAAEAVVVSDSLDLISIESLFGAPIQDVGGLVPLLAASKDAARLLVEHGVTARLLQK